jgi:RNA recognition motif-containing protein
MRHFTKQIIKADLAQLKPRKQSLYPTIEQNAQAILSEVSTLYVGNINEAADERVLARIFCRFGPISQIRLMLPRDTDQQRSLCCFVRFQSFAPAYLAKLKLHEQPLYG